MGELQNPNFSRYRLIHATVWQTAGWTEGLCTCCRAQKTTSTSTRQ